MKKRTFGYMVLLVLISACSIESVRSDVKAEMPGDQPDTVGLEEVTFGAGCFWCVEAVFEELKGVYDVEAGYSNGFIENPSYKDVCSGATGYAEVAKVSYDPSEISFEILLSVFFKTHDPTTLNRQGADAGTQYRSGIFYTSEAQKNAATDIVNKLNEEGAYPSPIVTEITPLKNYYKAENYHQDYYANNPDQGYCSYVIQPKVEKFRKVFKEYLK